jgi:hypothetical protein
LRLDRCGRGEGDCQQGKQQHRERETVHLFIIYSIVIIVIYSFQPKS